MLPKQVVGHLRVNGVELQGDSCTGSVGVCPPGPPSPLLVKTSLYAGVSAAAWKRRSASRVGRKGYHGFLARIDFGDTLLNDSAPLRVDRVR